MILIRRRSFYLSLALASAMLMSTAVHATSIAINFSEDDSGVIRPNQTLAPTDVAGHPIVAQDNWNNYIDTDTPGVGPVDDSGVSQAGTTVSWTITNPWGDGSVTGATPDERLARGNFDDGNTSGNIGVDVDVTGIPYNEYSVVLYLSSDNGPTGTFGSLPDLQYNVNGQTAVGGVTDGFATYGGWVPGSNVLAFTGLMGDLSIEAPNRVGDSRGTVAGFQIIEGTITIPEPANLVLFGVGSVILCCVSRRRR